LRRHARGAGRVCSHDCCRRAAREIASAAGLPRADCTERTNYTHCTDCTDCTDCTNRTNRTNRTDCADCTDHSDHTNHTVFQLPHEAVARAVPPDCQRRARTGERQRGAESPTFTVTNVEAGARRTNRFISRLNRGGARKTKEAMHESSADSRRRLRVRRGAPAARCACG
jgi:hypothetical protein